MPNYRMDTKWGKWCDCPNKDGITSTKFQARDTEEARQRYAEEEEQLKQVRASSGLAKSVRHIGLFGIDGDKEVKVAN